MDAREMLRLLSRELMTNDSDKIASVTEMLIYEESSFTLRSNDLDLPHDQIIAGAQQCEDIVPARGEQVVLTPAAHADDNAGPSNILQTERRYCLLYNWEDIYISLR